MQNLESGLQLTGPFLWEGWWAMGVADCWRLACATGKPLRWTLRPVSVNSGHIERWRWGQNTCMLVKWFLFFKRWKQKNGTPALYLCGWCLTLLPSLPRCRLDGTSSHQEGCSPAGHQPEGRAPLWSCGEGSRSSRHLIENTRNHSCSGHPSGSEVMSRSPHDRFHLFTGGIFCNRFIATSASQE